MKQIGDYRPKSIELKKGTYHVAFQIRHDNMDRLKTFENQSLKITKKLSKAVPLTIYSNVRSSVLKSNAISKLKHQLDERSVLYINCPDSISKMKLHAGDILEGSLRYYSAKTASSSAIYYCFQKAAAKKADADEKSGMEKADKRTPKEKYEENTINNSLKYLVSIKKASPRFADDIMVILFLQRLFPIAFF
mgnify:CR=1 FL=1